MIARKAWASLSSIAFVVVATPAPAASLNGKWRGPIGVVQITQKGSEITGVLLADSRVCPFKKGTRVLEGSLMMGNLSGRVRLCATGCADPTEHWAFSMLVRHKNRLSGAAAIKAARGCQVPGRGRKGGVMFRRLRKGKGKGTGKPGPGPTRDPSAPPILSVPDEDGMELADVPMGPEQEGYDPRKAADRREKAMNLARDGGQFLEEGRFEQARKRFEEAVAVDPEYAEGFNGIGVTHAMRRDWDEAARWYQRSIAANPDIGDAYYNLACAYAQTQKPDLAIRYLRLAVLNGYSEVAHLEADSDLEPIRDRKDFRAVLRLSRIGFLGPP